MQYTTKLETILGVIQRNCPKYDDSYEKRKDDQLLYIYIQDITKQQDFYVLYYRKTCLKTFYGDTIQYNDVVVLVDSLLYSDALYVDAIPYEYFKDDILFYKIYQKNKRPKLKEKKTELSIIKKF